ncbi:unnamed protein product [Trichogramma brassicae]|uniref:Apple domain-containing protein n=1 Tax=Trichogramma brassicae TaxID=86971 RepID=A0A6H5IJW8_9HYME|nr:unnamed protein product [Trichogramma brassicae]
MAHRRLLQLVVSAPLLLLCGGKAITSDPNRNNFSNAVICCAVCDESGANCSITTSNQIYNEQNFKKSCRVRFHANGTHESSPVYVEEEPPHPSPSQLQDQEATSTAAAANQPLYLSWLDLHRGGPNDEGNKTIDFARCLVDTHRPGKFDRAELPAIRAYGLSGAKAEQYELVPREQEMCEETCQMMILKRVPSLDDYMEKKKITDDLIYISRRLEAIYQLSRRAIGRRAPRRIGLAREREKTLSQAQTRGEHIAVDMSIRAAQLLLPIVVLVVGVATQAADDPKPKIRSLPVQFSTYAFERAKICCAQCAKPQSVGKWNCTAMLPQKHQRADSRFGAADCPLQLDKPRQRLPAWTFRAVALDPDSDWMLLAWLSRRRLNKTTSSTRIGKLILDFSTCTPEGGVDWTEVDNEGLALNYIHRLADGASGDDSNDDGGGAANKNIQHRQAMNIVQPMYDLTFAENKACGVKRCDVTVVRKN